MALLYDQEKAGFSATLLFNQIGRRILFVGNEAISNIWENPQATGRPAVSPEGHEEKGEIQAEHQRHP